MRLAFFLCSGSNLACFKILIFVYKLDCFPSPNSENCQHSDIGIANAKQLFLFFINYAQLGLLYTSHRFNESLLDMKNYKFK